MKPLLEATFIDAGEIRMGSPYNTATLRLEGKWTPTLPLEDWQDIQAISPDGTVLGLVRWDVPNNNPGFRIVTIDAKNRRVAVCERMQGCCTGIEWAENGFRPKHR